MTHQSELTHELKVYIEGVPAPIINKVISEAFRLYYQKHEDELCMSEVYHDEFMEIATAFEVATANIDYSPMIEDSSRFLEE